MVHFLTKLFCWTALAIPFCCFVFHRPAEAAVFRDRPAFNASSQNLNTIDFESAGNVEGTFVIDGVVFNSIGGTGIITGQNGSKVLRALSVGEITRLVVTLPPGTTAVACDQFATPMIISIPTGESVTMSASDTSTFVGFVSDQPIATLTVFFDFPEPTPPALVDNITYGQSRAGNESPTPQLLVATQTGRALALDSVMTQSEPFKVLAPHQLAADGHTRLTLFVVGVGLESADAQFVSVRAEDTQQRLFGLPVEATARVMNLRWMSQVTVRLPDAIAGVGNVNISVTIRGKTSNQAPVQIQ